MSYKTILAVVGRKTSDAFIRDLAELSYEAETHLSILVVMVAAPPPIGDYAVMISDEWFLAQQADKKALNSKVESVEAILSTTSSRYDVGSLYCEGPRVSAEIGARSIYADIVVVDDAEALGAHLRGQAIDGALFHGRRPVMLFQKSIPMTLNPKRVVLAWDSGPDAAAAATDALDLMKAANAVNVVIVNADDGEEKPTEDPGGNIATYLSRHGVRPIVDYIPAHGRSVVATLEQRCAELSADLIVMGAYGHSRLRERVFGGITQEMIDAATKPVLLSR